MMSARTKRGKPLYARRRTTKNRLSWPVYARRALVLLLLFALLAGLLLALIQSTRFAGAFFFSNNPRFELREMLLESDGRLTPAQLREYSGIETGMNLFEIDIPAVRRRLEEVPLIEAVTVERILPDKISIRSRERTAVAQIRRGRQGASFLIDRHGVVIPSSRAGLALPMIHARLADNLQPGRRIDDPAVMLCIQILKEADALGMGTRMIFGPFDLNNPEFVTVTVNGETTARFPHHSAREKLIRLIGVLQVAGEQGRRIRTVDLTPDGRNVPVTYY